VRGKGYGESNARSNSYTHEDAEKDEGVSLQLSASPLTAAARKPTKCVQTVTALTGAKEGEGACTGCSWRLPFLLPLPLLHWCQGAELLKNCGKKLTIETRVIIATLPLKVNPKGASLSIIHGVNKGHPEQGLGQSYTPRAREVTPAPPSPTYVRSLPLTLTTLFRDCAGEGVELTEGLTKPTTYKARGRG